MILDLPPVDFLLGSIDSEETVCGLFVLDVVSIISGQDDQDCEISRTLNNNNSSGVAGVRPCVSLYVLFLSPLALLRISYSKLTGKVWWQLYISIHNVPVVDLGPKFQIRPLPEAAIPAGPNTFCSSTE